MTARPFRRRTATAAPEPTPMSTSIPAAPIPASSHRNPCPDCATGSGAEVSTAGKPPEYPEPGRSNNGLAAAADGAAAYLENAPAAG
jgi:hypothetical protein